MIYEIVNPCDPMTIEASDDRVAAIVGLLLGEGRIGVRSAEGELVLPLMPFGPPDEWIEKMIGGSLDSFFTEKSGEIAACLESLLYVRIEERTSALEGLGAATLTERGAFNDERRSSISDFSSHAFQLATHIRGLAHG